MTIQTAEKLSKANSLSNNPGNTKHGMAKTRFYFIWKTMKRRCRVQESYKSKGIKVCDRWQQFINFKEDMFDSYETHCKEFGETDTTIDRINNFGDYELSNCRWATYKEQGNNTSVCKRYEVMGEMLTPREISDRYGINYWSIHSRIRRNKPLIKESELS